MLDSVAVMDLIESNRFYEHGISIQQARDSGLTDFLSLILAIGTGLGIMCFVIQRFFVSGHITFKVAHNNFMV